MTLQQPLLQLRTLHEKGLCRWKQLATPVPVTAQEKTA